MENQYHILIVDDDQSITELLEYNLQQNGYATSIAYNGVMAIQKAKEEKPHLLLLDVNMPKKDGYEVCDELRKNPQFNGTIIFFLTAQNDEESEIKGLELGADDYIGKPIKINVLLSRVKNALKDVALQGNNNSILNFEGISINKEGYQVILDGQAIELARKEFELLYTLAKSEGRVFDRNELLNTIWGTDVIVGDRTIDVHIRKIRAKLKERYIYTVKGVGYKFLPQ
jgi:two-component system, OmpR family, alkaline phosphatase synthesis response regulator PhoP